MTRHRPFWCPPARVVLAGALVLGACSSDGVTGGTGSWKPGTDVHRIVVGPLTRNYLLHVPARRPITTGGVVGPYSLVIVLHGSSGSGEDIRQTTQMDPLSETGRFLVAYPNGVQGAGGLYPSDWNAGLCCGAAGRENIDDVGFISAMIAEVGKKLALDKRRIYVVGFSDGGRMAHHLACKLSPTIAAIGVVSGSLKDDRCAPSAAVPVIAIHGTSDSQVPYDDPALTAPSKPLTAVAATLPPSVQFWLAANGCGGGAVSRTSRDVVRTSFASCAGAEVIFYSIEGGSHAWPGAGGSQPPMSELQASSVIYQFFTRQYRR
jgi:polyhydroxybutyrate depolymerase